MRYHLSSGSFVERIFISELSVSSYKLDVCEDGNLFGCLLGRKMGG